jgi:ligand-binding sensor domain-containing protein/serine phosphatase RsbU (regulator of sigma subunit)
MRSVPIFIILLSLFLVASAQRPYQRNHELFSGREDYQVDKILQDSTGIIWFGTNKGLFRFDGFSYDKYTTADGLAEDGISSLCWVGRGLLWIGHTNGAISHFDGRDFSKFEPEEGLGKVEITDIAVDPAGNIWYTTMGEGLFRYNGRHLANFDTENGLSDNYVYDIEVDRKGRLWLATDYGISLFVRDTFHRISMKDGLPDNIVRVLEISEGQVWLGTDEKGISSFDPVSGSFIHYGNWKYGPVTGIVAGPGKQIQVSTESMGLIEVDIQKDSSAVYRQIDETEGLVSNRLNTIIKDAEENLWIGGRRGVVQLLPPLFEFLGPESDLPFEVANSLVKDYRGHLWVCSERGLYRGLPNISGQLSWENISEKLGLEEIGFVSLFEDSHHTIWAGSLGHGLVIIDPVTLDFQQVDKNNGLSDNNIINIAGSDRQVWISTLGGGVINYDLDQGQFIHFNHSELKGNYIYSTEVDPQGRAWVAASLQYPLYIQGDSLHSLADSSYMIPALYGIAINSKGEVCFNTLSDGILKLGPEGVVHFGPAEGVKFKEIQSLAFDKYDRLLIFANSGLQILDTESGNSLYLYEQTGLGYRYPVLNSVHEDREGQIWFGTNTGIIKYNPDYLYIADQKPQVYISTLRLFDTAIDRTKVRYGYRSNNFTFGYTGLWYKNPEMLTFRYQLEGYDLEWNYFYRNRVITYPKLPPGHYAFHVEVSIDGVNWNRPEEAVYAFRIVPPFWKRWWFVLSMILLLVMGVLLYIRLRLASLEKAKKLLESQVKHRTEQIARKNQELESQKEEIATQRDYAEEQRDQIKHQRDEIKSSIRYARRIQSAALPPSMVMREMLKEYFIFSRPRDIVSGDFYWAARGADFIYFAVADCTGHGVPGAFLSMLGVSSLNDITKSMEKCTAAEALDQLAYRVRASLHQTDEAAEGTSVDGMDIALCRLDAEQGVLQFAGANIHLYLVRDGTMNVIRADRQDIASKYENPLPFTNHFVDVQDGDVIYLFTDGFPDQFGGKDRKKYKYGKFRDFLLDIHQEPMDRQREFLGKELNRWMGQYEQIDDVLVMGIRIRRASDPQ